MKNKLHINSLVLEVTRRCNMHCEHCLRGDAQNLDMQKEVVDKLLEQTETIFGVTFSGGEPTLNMPLIQYFFDKARETHTAVLSFYVVTNGKENQMELAVTLLKEYPQMEEQDYCGVSISVDDFHDAYTSLSPVRGLLFYQKVKEQAPGDDSWVMSRGRARENGLGRIRDESQSFDIEASDCRIYVDLLYVSADGHIYPDCDLSYEDMLDYPQIPVECACEYLTQAAKGEVPTVA